MPTAQRAGTMRANAAVAAILLVASACAEDGAGGGAADIQGDEDKADGTAGIEVTARIKPGSVDGELSTKVPRRGYVFYAAENAKVSLEVTQSGTASGLDTKLVVYGPRLADGSYPRTLASDDDSGYAKLSKIRELTITIPGFYLAEVSFGDAATPADGKKARLKLGCTGSCDSALPIDTDLGLKWYRRSAERRALAVQAYSLATEKLMEKAPTASGAWGVVLDIDETTLDNSTYQQQRMDLGLGYSPASWTEWVNRKAAPPLDGVAAFLHGVKQLGGKVVFVSNRLAATECAQTEANLAAASLPYDAILCKTGSSDKNPRFIAVKNGTAKPGLPALDALLYVGDNILDFPMLSQDLRNEAQGAYAKFGQDFILVPNPMYGSWEKNLDDNSL